MKSKADGWQHTFLLKSKASLFVLFRPPAD
jgi:hypothetical protein